MRENVSFGLLCVGWPLFVGVSTQGMVNGFSPLVLVLMLVGLVLTGISFRIVR